MHLPLLLALAASVPAPCPAQQEAFALQPDGVATTPAGDRLNGFVGYRTSPRLAAMYAAAGTGTGLYRRTVFLNERSDFRWIGEDFAYARLHGRRLWLTIVGTPSYLSPDPGATGNGYGTGLPEYARYPPTDPRAWAEDAEDFIADMIADFGVGPDYVEIWNEPERVEWFTGTADEFGNFYHHAASRLRALRPGLRLGGPGLAGVRSTMDLDQSLLRALIVLAGQTGAPLDFVSWHHYAPANELLYTGAVADLRELALQVGLGPIECIVSEWNIFPSAQGLSGPDFDRSHAAANFAGFVTTAYETGLDGNQFFLEVDETDDPGITDLAGTGLGALTHHGIKKPVFRQVEFLTAMAEEEILPVAAPAEEWSLRVFASRAVNRVRLVVSNDAIESNWVFSNRSREHGMDPGWLYPIYLAAGGRNATVDTLMREGLTLDQAVALLSFMPEVYEADRLELQPRTATIHLLGAAPFELGEAWRFDATHHAPAEQIDVLMPWLEVIEEHAQLRSAEATADFLIALGYSYTAQDLLAIEIDFMDWAALEGIPYGYAVDALKLMRDVLRDEALAYEENLNALPATALTPEPAVGADIAVSGRHLTVTLPPNTVTVFDLTFAPEER